MTANDATKRRDIYSADFSAQYTRPGKVTNAQKGAGTTCSPKRARADGLTFEGILRISRARCRYSAGGVAARSYCFDSWQRLHHKAFQHFGSGPAQRVTFQQWASAARFATFSIAVMVGGAWLGRSLR